MDKKKYLAEVSRVLKRNGFEVASFSEEQLPVLLNGEVACRVGCGGSLFIRPEDLHTEEANELFHKVAPFADLVAEYMGEMDKAPVLKASGLGEQYKQLANYGGVVLAGHELKKGAGMQFVTWLWDYDRQGVTLGHYFGNDYVGAKHDFAVRSGLIMKEKQFTPEQLTEIYRCCADTMSHNYELSYEQEKNIDEILTLITEMVPDFVEKMKASLESDPSQQMQGQTM